jgi:hypothetical protein
VDGACSTFGRGEKCIQNLVGKPEGKGPLGKRGNRCGLLASEDRLCCMELVINFEC